MYMKRTVIASIAALGLLSPAVSISIAAEVPAFTRAGSSSVGDIVKVSDGWGPVYASRHCRRIEDSRYCRWQYSHRHRNSGPPYGPCYMKCINSGHPADFCQNVSRQHFCY
jgi:hypothetical protein